MPKAMPTVETGDGEFSPVCPKCSAVTTYVDRRGKRVAWRCPGCGAEFETTGGHGATSMQLVSSSLSEFAGAGGVGAGLPSSALTQYLETALWSSTDENGNQLDERFNIFHFSPEARRKAEFDLSAFLEQVNDLAAAAESLHLDDASDSDLAHDFWLTRNRHGAGFWDKPEKYGPAAEALTELAHDFPEVSVYEADGQLEFT